MKRILPHGIPLAGIPMGTITCFAARPALDEGPKSAMMNHVIFEAIMSGKQVLYLNMESSCKPFLPSR